LRRAILLLAPIATLAACAGGEGVVEQPSFSLPLAHGSLAETNAQADRRCREQQGKRALLLGLEDKIPADGAAGGIPERVPVYTCL
jgi:hypothetical protein